MSEQESFRFDVVYRSFLSKPITVWRHPLVTTLLFNLDRQKQELERERGLKETILAHEHRHVQVFLPRYLNWQLSLTLREVIHGARVVLFQPEPLTTGIVSNTGTLTASPQRGEQRQFCSFYTAVYLFRVKTKRKSPTGRDSGEGLSLVCSLSR